ncbi:MAG: hypothetical protein H0U26_01780 [Acidimicrobiia bacterium]|nr:hypothetical protein [Acidimicrobiia bacterium]
MTMTDLQVTRPVSSAVTSRDPTNPRRRIPVGSVVALALLGVLLVWSRAIHLTEPLWTDEARALYAYVPDGPAQIMFSEYEVNNHIFFELLTWATSLVTGTSEASYRIWAFVPALASVAWLTVWLWSRVGRVAAVTFALLVTAAPLHLDLARQSRGYGLTYLAMAGLIVFGDAYNRSGRRRDIALFAVSGLVGFYTFPFFGFAFAFTSLTLVCSRRRWREVVVAVAAAGSVALLLMAHALPKLRESAGDFKVHDRLDVMGWGENLLWPLRIVGPTFGFSVDRVEEIRIRMWEPTAWEVFVVTIVVFPLMALAVVQLVRRERRLGALLLLPVVGTFLFVTSQHMAVWERYTSFYLYPAVIVVAFGAEHLARGGRRNHLVRAVTLAGLAVLSYPLLRAAVGTRPAVAATAALVVAIGLATRRGLPRSTGARLLGAGSALAALPLVAGLVVTTLDMRQPPREDFAGAADIVARSERPTVLTTRTTDASLYYLGAGDYSLVRLKEQFGGKVRRGGTTFLSEAQLNELLCTAPAPLVLVAPASDLRLVEVGCLEGRGATHTSLPMVLFGGSLEVWSLDAGP